MQISISCGVATTPSSSIIFASVANASSARFLTCSAVDGLLPFSSAANAAGFTVFTPFASLT